MTLRFLGLSFCFLSGAALAATEIPPSADPQGLEFSAGLVDDLQRGQGEPIIEIDRDGTVYACGPTGFSQNQDYASVSLDGGDQFNPIGQYPRGQFSMGGGGDCAIDTAPMRNAQGFYQMAYTGLYGLVSFSTATSPDRGATMNVNPNSRALPGVDRQWVTFTDADTVFHTYNRIAAPGGLTVQRSDDGGLTYGTETLVSTGSSGQGQIRSLPPELNPAANGMPAIYYPWSAGTAVNLAVSLDEGATWSNCVVVAKAKGSTDNKFPAADHDNAGNIYFAYTESSEWNTYVTAISNAELLNCKGGVGGAAQSKLKAIKPVLANRDQVITTAFPWLIASGEPGRVAVTYYGSEINGAADAAPSVAPHVWHVYVSQSLNFLDAEPTFAQVRATTHPMHYDQICQNGLGCTTGGDRSLVDFFAIDYNRSNGELAVVYNWAHKRPGDAFGMATATVVLRQIAGPSNGGGFVDNKGRTVLRSATADPEGDAYVDFSDLFMAGKRGSTAALDVTHVEIGESGDPNGGFTAHIKVKDLSDNALKNALTELPAQSLLWIFYYIDGYRYHAASARWNPVQGFTFGHNGYTASVQECGTPSVPLDPSGDLPAEAAGNANPDQCVYYPGDTPLTGKVDQASGTIEITVGASLLTALRDVAPPARSPAEVPARPGDRIYSASVYTQGNPYSPTQDVQGWLIPVDNTAPMDFLVPGEPPVAPAEPAVKAAEVADLKQGKGLFLGALPVQVLLAVFGFAALGRRGRSALA